MFDFSTFDTLEDGKQRRIPALILRPRVLESPAPVLISIHGGPESQSRPRFSSLHQFLVNELGIAVISPNVRGSSGFGKTFLELDNGYKREDSVRDIP
jgi:dipeptidyl aminopeptidase/acylaminoacyl peptidase